MSDNLTETNLQITNFISLLDGSYIRTVEVPNQIIVEPQGLHMSMHIDAFVDSVRIRGAALAGRGPAIDVLSQICGQNNVSFLMQSIT